MNDYLMDQPLDRFFETDPFVFSDANRADFLESFRESAARNYKGSEFFRRLWQKKGLLPGDLKTEADLVRVPSILVSLFKEHALKSVPDSEVVLTLTSSGTSGRKSQIFLNAGSLARVKRSAYQIHASLGMTTPEKTNYVCFTYDPRVAKDLGTAFTDDLLTSFTGIQRVYYALQWDEAKGDFIFNSEGVVETLREFAAEGLPVRLLGFPAFLYKVLLDSGLRLNLGKNSWVQTGGGWKTFADEELPKHEFRAFVADRLGIPVTNIRDMFGMVEHGIPYVDCERGQLHVPNYARVWIRSPEAVKGEHRLLPVGERGLIQFMCSYLDSYPSISLLTTDWGRLGYCDCPIGRAGSQTLEILGRAGISQHKGCAITALEKLR